MPLSCRYFGFWWFCSAELNSIQHSTTRVRSRECKGCFGKVEERQTLVKLKLPSTAQLEEIIKNYNISNNKLLKKSELSSSSSTSSSSSLFLESIREKGLWMNWQANFPLVFVVIIIHCELCKEVCKEIMMEEGKIDPQQPSALCFSPSDFLFPEWEYTRHSVLFRFVPCGVENNKFNRKNIYEQN